MSKWENVVRTSIVVASVLVLSSAPALAGDDIMAGYYGNTVVSVGGVLESHTHYRADHTFDVSATAMGQSFNDKGTWIVDDKGQLCRTYESPPPGFPNPLCIPGGTQGRRQLDGFRKWPDAQHVDEGGDPVIRLQSFS